jgi:hypothetical protein
MTPELKKAIIRCVPEYLTCDTAAQEQYRVTTPEEDQTANLYSGLSCT